MSSAVLCTALCACGTDNNSTTTPLSTVSDSIKESEIAVNTSDSNSKYYGTLIDGNYNYTIEKFENNYSFSSKEGIDVIDYTGAGSDNYASINIFPSNQSIKDTASKEIENAKLRGFTKVNYENNDSSMAWNHIKISASEPEGEGVVPNSANEVYVLENGNQALVVSIGYTSETKDTVYPYLIAMVRTIKLK